MNQKIVSKIMSGCQECLWITKEGKVFFETFTKSFDLIQEFLSMIAEPISRPKFIHEYHITQYSIHAACSLGLNGWEINKTLQHLTKVELPDTVHKMIETTALSYGKVKLLLLNGRYFVESIYPDTLSLLKADKIISSAFKKEEEKKEIILSKIEAEKQRVQREITGSLENYEINLKNPENCFEIEKLMVDTVKKRCISLEYPVLEEFDFKNDKHVPSLEINLRPTTIIRDYQEHSLSKMFAENRARSGIIILPCGAGKTLVGIAATCTIKKRTFIMCTSAVSVEQWRKEILKYTTIPDKAISRFTSDTKEKSCLDNDIIITTYNMIVFNRARSKGTMKIMENIKNKVWGLLILDEVHVVPANIFRTVTTNISAYTKLGLTATFLREDKKITDLNFLIGPKLHEANWYDLANSGHIANVSCIEIWCQMPNVFFREYLKETPRIKRLLYTMNPTKFNVCKYLINKHEALGDKIIVFSDNLFALKRYAIRLKKPYIYGPTSQAERMLILSEFRKNPLVNTIFLSKVGDTSIDIPEANCLIQISSHYGSRRQEAQRLGRILRAKKKAFDGFNAFFYSLISKDTSEMHYASKRQQFLINQGYAFKIIPQGELLCDSIEDDPAEFLKEVLMSTDMDIIEEDNVFSDNCLDDDKDFKKIKIQ